MKKKGYCDFIDMRLPKKQNLMKINDAFVIKQNTKIPLKNGLNEEILELF